MEKRRHRNCTPTPSVVRSVHVVTDIFTVCSTNALVVASEKSVLDGLQLYHSLPYCSLMYIPLNKQNTLEVFLTVAIRTALYTRRPRGSGFELLIVSPAF